MKFNNNNPDGVSYDEDSLDIDSFIDLKVFVSSHMFSDKFMYEKSVENPTLF